MKCPYPGCNGDLTATPHEHPVSREILRYLCSLCGSAAYLYPIAVENAEEVCQEQGKRECHKCGYWHKSGEWCPINPPCLHTIAQGYETCRLCNVVTAREDTHNCIHERKWGAGTIKKSFAVKDALKSSLTVAFNEDGSVTVTPNVR